MARLIDADALVSYIEEELALKYTGYLGEDVVCGMISRQNEIIQFIKAYPTAYNVEAVLQSVKDIGTRFCTQVHCENECSNCEHGSIMRAIISEIEKGGADMRKSELALVAPSTQMLEFIKKCEKELGRDQEEKERIFFGKKVE